MISRAAQEVGFITPIRPAQQPFTRFLYHSPRRRDERRGFSAPSYNYRNDSIFGHYDKAGVITTFRPSPTMTFAYFG